jgi:hypothetical protein
LLTPTVPKSVSRTFAVDGRRQTNPRTHLQNDLTVEQNVLTIRQSGGLRAETAMR